MSKLRETIKPKSDQLNFDDLIGRTIDVRVTGLKQGSAEQPVVIEIARGDEVLRPFKPCKGIRRLLVILWGEDGKAWIGKSMRLYGDPTVRYGGQQVGGVRVSHVSGISEPTPLMMAVARGKRVPVTILPLEEVK